MRSRPIADYELRGTETDSKWVWRLRNCSRALLKHNQPMAIPGLHGVFDRVTQANEPLADFLQLDRPQRGCDPSASRFAHPYATQRAAGS